MLELTYIVVESVTGHIIAMFARETDALMFLSTQYDNDGQPTCYLYEN
jgi:hypothetical protein